MELKWLENFGVQCIEQTGSIKALTYAVPVTAVYADGETRFTTTHLASGILLRVIHSGHYSANSLIMYSMKSLVFAGRCCRDG